MFLDLDFKFKTCFKILLDPKLHSKLPKVNHFSPILSPFPLPPSYKVTSRKPIICRQIQLGKKKKGCLVQSRKTNKQAWEHQENQEPHPEFAYKFYRTKFLHSFS